MKTFALLVTLALGASALNLEKAQAPEGRIINGQEATASDFPYQVALFVFDEALRITGQKCGGALITNRHVLTAAHCFPSSKKGWAWVGTNRYQQGTQLTFSHVEIHENWNSELTQNDIAVVHLDRPVELNGRTIATIPLDTNYLPANVPLIVSGYGLVADNQDTDKLYYTQLTSIRNDDCRVYKTPITDQMLCSRGSEGRATCQGDSGGPLVRYDNNGPIHVGIVSFGPDSCHKNAPLVFTRTSEYIRWIESKLY